MRFCQIISMTLCVIFFIPEAKSDLSVRPTKICLSSDFNPMTDTAVLVFKDTEYYRYYSKDRKRVNGTVRAGYISEAFLNQKVEGISTYTLSIGYSGYQDCLSAIIPASKLKVLSSKELEQAQAIISGIDLQNAKELKSLNFSTLLEIIPPTSFDTRPPLIDGYPSHDFYAYVLEDSYVYTREGVQTPSKLSKGSVVGISGSYVSIVPGFPSRYILSASADGLLPVLAIRILEPQELDVINNLFFPVYERTATPITNSSFYFRPDQDSGAKIYMREDEGKVEVLRTTKDGEWYFARQWNTSRNIWNTGFIPIRTVRLDPTPEEVAAEEAREKEKAEADRLQRIEDEARAAEVGKVQREKELERIAEEEKTRAREAERQRLVDLEKQATQRRAYLYAFFAYMVFFIGAFFFPAYRYFALEKWMRYYDKLKEIVGSPRGFPALLAVSFVAFGLAAYLKYLGITNIVFFISAAFGLLAGCILVVAAVGSFWTAFLLPGLFVALWENLRFLLSTRTETFEEVPLGDEAEDNMSASEYRWRKYQYDRQHEYYESRANARDSETKDRVYDKVNEQWKKRTEQQ